jgi:hypothetical protein
MEVGDALGSIWFIMSGGTTVQLWRLRLKQNAVKSLARLLERYADRSRRRLIARTLARDGRVIARRFLFGVLACGF